MNQEARNELFESILGLGLRNPVSGYDVDAEDVGAYIDEAKEINETPTKKGFKYWLKHGYCESLSSYYDTLIDQKQ